MKYPGEHTKKPHGNPPSNLPGYRLNDLERRGVPPENPPASSPGIAQLPGRATRLNGVARFRRSVSVGAYVGLTRRRCQYGMANMARALLEHEHHPGRRLGAMRTGLTIGPPEDIARTIEALGAAELCNVYGSTETYGNCAVTDAHDPLALRLHSQGLPLRGMAIRVVDPVTRRPLPEGEIGELDIGGYVTPGYYRAPELDAEAFDGDGYFLTGDLGTIESDGRIRFRGRLKGDDQDRRRQRRTARGRASPVATFGHRAGLRRGRSGSVEGRDRRRSDRAAGRGGNRSRGDPRLLP